MKRETRYYYAAAVAVRYQHSSREQKGWILDEFCAATGYNRKYAIKLLCGPFPRAAVPVGHGRPPVYGPEDVAVLRTCWEIADHVCSKRLVPFLSELLGQLRACGELSDLSPGLVDRVANMSAATSPSERSLHLGHSYTVWATSRRWRWSCLRRTAGSTVACGW